MTARQMIQIDETRCDGCGACIPACPEGALQVVEGKARVVRESYCDGLGACLGECPQGALQVVELETEAYDEAGVIAHLRANAPEALPRHLAHLQAHAPHLMLPAQPDAPVAACPSLQIRLSAPPMDAVAGAGAAETGAMGPAAQGPSAVPPASELRQWPVQLRLLPVRAPFFEDAVLTLVADCVPFAQPDFHAQTLKGSAVAVGCPKLDDAQAYIDKVAQIVQANHIRKLRVAYMEVPCCRGLVWIAQQALARSGADIPLETEMIDIELAS